MSFSDKTIPIQDRLRDSSRLPNCFDPSLLSLMAEAADKIDGLTALAKLGRWVLEMRSEHECADLGGDDLENKSIELGLLAEVMATESCGEGCHCNTWDTFPQACLRPTDKAKALDK